MKISKELASIWTVRESQELVELATLFQEKFPTIEHCTEHLLSWPTMNKQIYVWLESQAAIKALKVQQTLNWPR